MARCPVGDASEDQLTAIALENDVPVLERKQSQRGEVCHPCAVAKNVFVIPGDHVDAVGRPQVPQRPDVGASRFKRAIDQISVIAIRSTPSLFDRSTTARAHDAGKRRLM